jgi:hypothetical protein
MRLLVSVFGFVTGQESVAVTGLARVVLYTCYPQGAAVIRFVSFRSAFQHHIRQELHHAPHLRGGHAWHVSLKFRQLLDDARRNKVVARRCKLADFDKVTPELKNVSKQMRCVLRVETVPSHFARLVVLLLCVDAPLRPLVAQEKGKGSRPEVACSQQTADRARRNIERRGDARGALGGLPPPAHHFHASVLPEPARFPRASLHPRSVCWSAEGHHNLSKQGGRSSSRDVGRVTIRSRRNTSPITNTSTCTRSRKGAPWAWGRGPGRSGAGVGRAEKGGWSSPPLSLTASATRRGGSNMLTTDTPEAHGTATDTPEAHGLLGARGGRAAFDQSLREEKRSSRKFGAKL